MIKQIFTWWNSHTFGTFLYTIFFGKLVGKDEFGNKYYKNSKGKRWVIYNGEINASKITSDWFSWIHNISSELPEKGQKEKYIWQKPHKENKTGTKESLQPKLVKKIDKKFRKYESWKP